MGVLYAAVLFILVVGGPAGAAGSPALYLQPVTYGVGAQPYSVAVGDVTGDGVPDVLVTTGLGGDADFRDRMGKLIVFPGVATGGLAAPRVLPTHDSMAETQTESQRTVVVGDFNADGKMDAATVTPAGVDVFYQDAGMLSAPVLVPGTAGADNLAAADVSGDGTTDLVVEVVQPTTGTASVMLLRSGSTGFIRSTIWSGNLRPWSLQLGDLNGDGRADIVIGGESAPVWFWTLIQQNDGSFAAHAYNSTDGSCCVPLALADVTGDGRLDVTLGGAAAAERVFPGTGTGDFAAPVVYPNSDGPAALVGADLNGDQRTDLVVASGGTLSSDASVELFMQTASGQLASPVTLFMPFFAAEFQSSKPLAVGDLNNDGRADIAAAETNTGQLVIFPQAGPDQTLPTTTITGGPSGQSPSTVTFAFNSNEAGTFVCSINGGSYAGRFRTPCSSPVTYAGLAAQQWNFTVAAIDSAGNVDASGATRSFTVSVPVFSPAAPSNDRFSNALTLTGTAGSVSGDNSEATFEVGEPQASPNVSAPVSHTVWFSWTAPASGTVTLDTAGSSIDTILGVFTGSALSALTPVASHVPGPMRQASLAFQAHGGTTYLIQLDGWTHLQTAITESGPYTLVWSLNGATPPPPPDTTPPETSITSAPSGSTTATDATFAFVSSEASSSFKCSLDNAVFAVCVSPKSYSGLAVGQHSFQVEAIDASGNVDPTPASASWTVKAATPPPPSAGGGGGSGSGGGGGMPPDLRIALTANTASPAVGTEVIYSVAVSIANDASATGIELTVQLPQGVDYLHSYADRGPGCTLERPGVLRCHLDWLSPPLVAHVNIWTQVNHTGTLVATANVAEDQQDINPADNTATLTLAGPVSQPPAPTSGVAGVQAALQVRIVGEPIVGHRLVAAPRLATGRLRYHWEACSNTRCSTIPGATRSSLQVRPVWLGKRLRVSVVALDSGGRATATTPRIRSR